MALKKPSDYFKPKENLSVNNSVQELVKTPELNTFSDAFESFKKNLGKIEVLSDFSETLDNYRVNIERVNFLSERIEDIKTEIQTLLTKEDLERAMMSQLLVVEKSICDVQTKVKGINDKNLTEIRLDVVGLTETVSQFLDVEVPKYKKLVVDSELRTNARYEELESNVNLTLDGIGEFVEDKYQQLTETLQGINESSLSGVVQEFKKLDEAVLDLKEQEIPKYKGFIVETERKVEFKLDKFDEKLDESIDDLNLKIENTLTNFDEKVEERIDILQSSLQEFIQVEYPKYNKLLIENKLKTEEEIKIIQKNIEEKVQKFVDDIEELRKNALTDSESLNQFVKENIDSFKNILDNTQNDVKKTLSTYTNISKTFEDKVTKDSNKLYEYEETLNQYSEKIEDCLFKLISFEENYELNQKLQKEWEENLKLNIDQTIETHQDVVIEEIDLFKLNLEKRVSDKIEEYQEVVNEEISTIQDSLTKKVSDLEIEIVRNESHIKKQNQSLEKIQEDVRFAIQKLNLEELEEQNYELGKKVKYLEEVFEKFSEKEILSENILTEPPEVKNEDPLTPLDQNFVTLDQLNQHYRLFLNRIQQQLATIGGGGETRLKYLDDIVGISTNASAYDNKFLKYNHSIGKFEFVTVSGGGGGSGESYWEQGIVGIVTSSNIGVRTDNPTSALTVYGDSLIVGVVTATDFNSASDIKLKDNVSIIDNPIDKIIKLEGVNFSWKETGKKSLGVIAQEVEKVLPELVSGEESKTVNYNGIIGLLIECVKHQQKEIEELKKRIDK